LDLIDAHTASSARERGSTIDLNGDFFGAFPRPMANDDEASSWAHRQDWTGQNHFGLSMAACYFC
jgi:hypothetical protein